MFNMEILNGMDKLKRSDKIAVKECMETVQ